MPRGTEVGLAPGDMMLDGERGRCSPDGKLHCILPLSWFTVQACIHANRGPCLLWPNTWMDQDAIWYRGRPQPRRHCVRWGPAASMERQNKGRGGAC